MTGNVLDDSSSPASKDNLDALLRAYFQAQMPCPWPACPQPSSTILSPIQQRSPASRTWLNSAGRSRLALAASVVFLIGGILFLGSNLASPSREITNPLSPSSSDSAERPELPGSTRYRQSDSLLQKPDGTYYKIEFFELPPKK